MTDTTVAQSGGAAAPNETVIEQAPAGAPQPLGAQAPDKPTGDVEGNKTHPLSRREAIQKAFDRASNPPAKPAKADEKPAPKAAEAKPGHNNPPEKTEQTFDLKKRPADQPRGERGQFAPRDVQNAQNTAQNSADPTKQGVQKSVSAAQQLPEGAPYRDPPPRMAETAKRDWATTPETVRGDFHRLAKEAGEMYRQYRPDHDKMNTIRHFDEMATQHGTTLERALNNYVTMEQKLRSDVVGGLDVIINNLNLRTPDGRKLNLRDISYHVLNQSPALHKLSQTQNAQAATSHQIGALPQELSSLKDNAINQMHTAQEYTYTRSTVEQFADQHPRFDELANLIKTELDFGFDLETAYRRAELLSPTTHAAQTRTPSAQTRPTDKSISGAPGVAPSNGASPPKKPVGRREAISNAMRTVGVA